MQISLEVDANHRSLRRCYSCGTYARPYDQVDGAIRCERCAEKARRQEREEKEDPSRVDFLI
jgi:DNA-directed RNA polymerase subunit RPC12/RpoP